MRPPYSLASLLYPSSFGPHSFESGALSSVEITMHLLLFHSQARQASNLLERMMVVINSTTCRYLHHGFPNWVKCGSRTRSRKQIHCAKQREVKSSSKMRHYHRPISLNYPCSDHGRNEQPVSTVTLHQSLL